MEIQEMVFAKAVRHAFEPHTAHNSLLDTRDDRPIYGRPPQNNGREQHQQVARKLAKNFWMPWRELVAEGNKTV